MHPPRGKLKTQANCRLIRFIIPPVQTKWPSVEGWASRIDTGRSPIYGPFHQRPKRERPACRPRTDAQTADTQTASYSGATPNDNGVCRQRQRQTGNDRIQCLFLLIYLPLLLIMPKQTRHNLLTSRSLPSPLPRVPPIPTLCPQLQYRPRCTARYH